MKPNHVGLIDHSMTVNGLAFPASGTFGVINPATGEVFDHAPALAPDQLDSVFAFAAEAFEQWKRVDRFRCERLSAAADAIESATEELALLLTAEQGKPLDQARNEVTWSCDWMRYFANLEIPREVLRDDSGGYEEICRRPMGVVAAIAPWNFPLLLAMWKIAPALRAGNTVVLKPSPYTPLSTLGLGRVLRGVLPDGVLNVVSGPDPLGALMVEHIVPRKVSFTGSTETGKRVAASAAKDLKRLTLELGGNDPAIVLSDAPLQETATGLFAEAFANNGQTCHAIKRIYAHESIADELVERLAVLARNARVDDGMAEGAELGPINNLAQFERVKGLVDDAVRRGGRVVAGGTPLDRAGYFYPPTIVDCVTDDMPVVAEEQFGPVIPVLTFRDEDEAVLRANNSPYGLTASVWSADLESAYRLAARLDCGQVSVNAHSGGLRMDLPFGGRKWSGIGVENGIWGYYGFTEPQVIVGPGRGAATI